MQQNNLLVVMWGTARVHYAKPIPGAKVDCICYNVWGTFWREHFGALL